MKHRTQLSRASLFTKSMSSLFFLIGCGKSPAHSTHYQTPFQSSGKKVHLSGKTYLSGSSISVLIDESCAGVGLHEKTEKLTLAHDTSVEEIQKYSENDPCILGISDHRIATTESFEEFSESPDTHQDPLLHQQPHLDAIEAPESYRTFFDPAHGIQTDVVIAVIDTGMDLHHPDLKDNLWTNPAELQGLPGVDDDGDGFIDDIYGYNFPSAIGDPNHQTINDHGTHVAGLVAATHSNGIGGTGVMGERVKLMALNVFGKNWGAETQDIDTAIRFAADHGAQVINLSVGGPGQSETTAAAIVYALNRGVIVIASAGNLRQNIEQEFYFPASYAPQYSGMISVGASNIRTSGLCEFSNYSPHRVEIAAPGCDDLAPRSGLFSTLSKEQYGYKKGTSMAAPLVSGAAALAYGLIRDRKNGPVQVSEVEEILMRSSLSQAQLQPYIIGGRSLQLKRLAEEIDRAYPNRR